jgi:glycine/serine hydroxymethyltransferase
MDEAEMGEVASIIGDVLKHPDDGSVKEKSGQRVRDLMERFPLYP